MANNGGHSSDSEGEYCYVCEDGGATITCTICSRSYCYSILGDASDDADFSACVSVPRDMVTEAGRAFPCPVCLETVQAQAAPYVINRAARATQRRVLHAAVVLVIFHIESLQDLALSVQSQIQAALNAFQINLASYCGKLDGGISDEDQRELMAEIDPDLHHHVAVIFITESQPGGGWWWESGNGSHPASQVDEVSVLKHMHDSTRILARAALSVRYFGLLCGWSLDGDGVVPNIAKYLTSTPVKSLVLPTASAALPGDIGPMLPELMLNLYYFGRDLRDSIYKVWGRSDEARDHTGLLVMDRDHSALRYRKPGPFADAHARPTEVKEHKREALFAYKSLCCGLELHLAVFLSRLRCTIRNELPFTEEDWDPETSSFHFNPATMVRMTVHPPTPSGQELNTLQGNPKTLAGKKTAAEVARRRAERTRDGHQTLPSAVAPGPSSSVQ
ncbi:ATPase [Ceratobasidium sp. AG-Ba]|nr:ATPase [Ceratobasidium sp. AG-Ba]QRW09507.1 ATPase [Ceratobasidium sp. AG-Ba]